MIINYNHSAVGSEMISYISLYGNGDKSTIADLTSLFTVGNLIGGSGPINRLENYKFCFNFEHTTIPDISLMKPLSFAEASLRTAEDMWRFVGSRELVLYWSGGYDSTAAIISLAQTNENWKQQLKILTTPYATETEYPWFYHNMLNGVEVTVDNPDVILHPRIFDTNKIYTSGACGDQLFGCTSLTQLSSDIWGNHYSSLYDTDMFKKYTADVNKDDVIGYIEKCVTDFSGQVSTIKDIFWMLAFTHKWDVVKYRLHKKLLNSKNPKSFDQLRENIIAFFDSDHYQGWALMSPDTNTSLNDYKKTIRDYIRNYTKDYDYNANKIINDYDYKTGVWRNDNNAYGTLDKSTGDLDPADRTPAPLIITTNGIRFGDNLVLSEFTDRA